MTAITDLLSRVSLGPARTHRALGAFPVLLSPAPEADQTPLYLVLDEALATGRFRVTEISDAGSVPQLRALNDLDRAVFLLDGEELVGAKQNRVLNLSLLVAAGSKTDIPVSCVEAGRWHRMSDDFAAAPRTQFAEGRARKMASVSMSLRASGEARSDQGEVWDTISAKSMRMRISSETSAMSEMFEQSRPALGDYLSGMGEALPDQIGAVYTIGGRIAGLDLFDSPATWSRLAPKLHSSYALDAMEGEGKQAALPGEDAVRAFLADVAAAGAERFPTTGLGQTLRLEASGLTGAALEVDGRCIHLAAFPAPAADSPLPRMTRGSLRARRH